MGCDIHAHVEIKANEEWHYYAQAGFWRDYSLFAKMANVRNDGSINCISMPRGLPKDVSFVTRMHSDDYGIDGHSHSWLSYQEMLLLLDWLGERGNERSQAPWGSLDIDAPKFADFGVWLFGNRIRSLKLCPNEYPPSLQDVRLVFWFDN